MTQLYIKKPSGRYGIAEAACVLDAASTVIDQLFATGEQLASAQAAGDLLKLRLGFNEYEVFYVLYLDSRNRIIAEESLFRGTINGAAVYPREVVKQALLHNAAFVIFAHNHPSGVAQPSEADIAITTQLKKALRLVEVTVLDHFIVGEAVYSFAENGQL